MTHSRAEDCKKQSCLSTDSQVSKEGLTTHSGGRTVFSIDSVGTIGIHRQKNENRLLVLTSSKNHSKLIENLRKHRNVSGLWNEQHVFGQDRKAKETSKIN